MSLNLLLTKIPEILEIPEQSTLVSLVNALPESVKNSVLKHKSDNNKLQKIFGYLLLQIRVRKRFGDNLTLPLKIMYEEKGRPYLTLENPFYFNLSHSGGMVLLGISTDFNIGVDVQKIEKNSFEKLAKRFYTLKEISYIESFTTKEDQQQAFYTIWCLKESYLKAIGTGISKSLQSISFEISNETITLADSDSDSDSGTKNKKVPFSFKLFKLENYMIAICHPSSNIVQDVELESVDYKDIINYFIHQ